MKAPAARRITTLWRLGHRRGAGQHRYFGYRMAAFALIHLFLAVVPLAGILRFDFWRGNHMLWFHRAAFLDVLRDFVIPFGLVNIAIVLVVRWTGRYLCGWVCPVNFMNRWGDWLRGLIGARDSRLGIRGHSLAALTSGLFAGVFLLWFLDFRVFTQGSRTAILWSLGAWSFLALVSYVQIVLLSWRTCRRYCPSGVYFSVLGTHTRTGIERNPDGEDCASCNLCLLACPMDLDPRNLSGKPPEPRGIYFETPDSTSLCIRCGDCVEACERFFEPRHLKGTLRMGFLKGCGSALPPAEKQDAGKAVPDGEAA
ncbi:MAG: 4Fe-4S binding protein [Planctomycetota bacterium]